jgi:hypothetical protein
MRDLDRVRTPPARNSLVSSRGHPDLVIGRRRSEGQDLSSAPHSAVRRFVHRNGNKTTPPTVQSSRRCRG